MHHYYMVKVVLLKYKKNKTYERALIYLRDFISLSIITH